MYKLYIANKNYSSWSLRPWILMTELSISFEEILTPFIAGSNWEEFRKFSPTGRVPCLLDGGRKIWDSLAITEYLAERHENIWPKDEELRAWARCVASEMHSGFSELRNICPMNFGVEVTLNSAPSSLKNDINRIDELWCEGIDRFGGPFLAGNNFTAVDAFFVPVASRIKTYNLKLSSMALAYSKMLLSLKSVKSWEKSALLETWREPGHEQDTERYGAIVKDYRKV